MQKTRSPEPFPLARARQHADELVTTTEILGGVSLLKNRSRKFLVYDASKPNGTPPIAHIIVDTKGNATRHPAPQKRMQVKRKS